MAAESVSIITLIKIFDYNTNIYYNHNAGLCGKRKTSEGGRSMKQILIVDDDGGIREACREALREEKYTVITASGAEEALEILNSTFNLVISDLMMPQYDGLWLARQVKKKFEGKIPVIIMSGSICGIKPHDIREGGIIGVLPKPFGADDLLRTILQALSGTISLLSAYHAKQGLRDR
jgi:CheY-like chemotaxis protein